MANKVTGSTDTTGALSVAPSMVKSVLVIGQVNGAVTNKTDPNKVFSIVGTADTKARFGEDSILTDAVKVLIQNGVDTFTGIIVDSETGEDSKVSDNYAKALEASLGNASVQFIVLDKYDADIINEVRTHLAMAEVNDMFRYAVVAGETDDNDALIEFAGTINDSRIFIIGPTMTDGSAIIDRAIVAAGVTGQIITNMSDPALPMNGVTINGIGNVNKAVLESERNLLAANQVTALYNDGLPTIHRLVTSSNDPVWQEGTTRFIADYVLENVENTLRANYKRTKNVTRILASIRTTVKGLLEGYESREIIENFDESTLTVVQDPADKYGALVDYEIDVVTPLYTITINQHMKL